MPEGITHRKTSSVRIDHSFASRAIEQGIPITQIAYMMGHSDLSMVTKTYGHLMNKPTDLPDLLN